MSIATVGLLGLGNMGAALGERLLDTGIEVLAYDLNAEAAARLAGHGAVIAVSARQVADQAAVVIASLPSVAASHAVAAEVAGGSSVRHYVETSTIGPDAAREIGGLMQRNGIGFIDAAVSGGAPVARKGELAMMLAGDDASLAAVRPLLSRLSASMFEIGTEPGQAQLMKLVNNIVAAANMASAFEALILGTRLGLNPAMVVDVLNAGSARSMALVERRANAILSGRFDSGPKIALLQKDVQLALDAASAAGFPLEAIPTLRGAAELWADADKAGMAGQDVSALIRIVEDKAGVVARAAD